MCDGRRKNIQRLPTLLVFMVGLSFAFLACGCVSVRYALAEDGSGGGSFDYGVVYGPNSTAGLSDYDNPRYLVQVYAPNKFDAALLALGYKPTSSSFTDDARAYLSNQSTGGAFYDFAQLFSNNNTDWGEEISTNPSLTPGINFDVTNMETALKVNNSIYGADNVWSAEYTTTQRIAAVTAVGLVLSGSIGGGGGSTGFGSTLTATDKGINYIGASTATAEYRAGTINGIMVRPFSVTNRNGENFPAMLPNIELNVNTTQFNELIGTGCKAYMQARPSYNGSYPYSLQSFRFYIYVTDIEPTVTDKTANYSGQTFQYKEYSFAVTEGSTFYLLENVSGTLGEGLSYTISNRTFSKGVVGRTYVILNTENNGPDNWWINFGDVDVVVPPTNWPDPPENPTVDPPSVPDPPTDDPIQQPTDTPIQPPNVWMPIAGTTDPTFTVDLQGILDAMAAHCQHIRDNLDGNFAQLYNNMTDYWSRKYTNLKQFLDGQFGYIGDMIVDKTDDLMDYLQDLFEWLAEQFDWSVSGTGYNDNTVVSWLRKIYNRLGGGTTIRPPDPVVDPKGIGDWLNQLLQNLVLDLLAIGQDVLADLVESFRELITKFPFSIPWDIAAILALLVAEPLAPVIEIPQYTYTGLTLVQVGTYRLDLSQWNSVMDIVRPMETILFAGWLAFKTDFFKGLLEMTKG